MSTDRPTASTMGIEEAEKGYLNAALIRMNIGHQAGPNTPSTMPKTVVAMTFGHGISILC